jgi:hypothetical protein
LIVDCRSFFSQGLACLAAFLIVLPHPAAADAPVATSSEKPANPADDHFFLGHNLFVGTNTGWIGVGTNKPASAIDTPTGEIKPGSSGVPCRPAIAGALRYADGHLKLCDGAGWRNVSLDKPE